MLIPLAEPPIVIDEVEPAERLAIVPLRGFESVNV